MNKKENPKGRFAFAFPILQHRDEKSIETLGVVGGTDNEIIDDVLNEIEAEIGSPILRLTPEQGRMTANRYYFSSSRWNAPWQPTGPKPPGEHNLN